jgi:regulatory protein
MTRKITALKQQKRNPDRVNVYLDGEFAFGLAKIVAGWLTLGAELSEEKITELRAQDDVEVAMQKTWNFLSYRARTEKEMRDRLAKYGYSEAVIEEVLARMTRHGYVDDSSFAAQWVENRSEFRPRGARALRMELRQKGVTDKRIDQAVDNLDEAELALRAARKQARRYEDLEWDAFRKKMYGFLARRGFNYDDINKAALQAWDEIGEDPAGEAN